MMGQATNHVMPTFDHTTGPIKLELEQKDVWVKFGRSLKMLRAKVSPEFLNRNTDEMKQLHALRDGMLTSIQSAMEQQFLSLFCPIVPSMVESMSPNADDINDCKGQLDRCIASLSSLEHLAIDALADQDVLEEFRKLHNGRAQFCSDIAAQTRYLRGRSVDWNDDGFTEFWKVLNTPPATFAQSRSFGTFATAARHVISGLLAETLLHSINDVEPVVAFLRQIMSDFAAAETWCEQDRTDMRSVYKSLAVDPGYVVQVASKKKFSEVILHNFLGVVLPIADILAPSAAVGPAARKVPGLLGCMAPHLVELHFLMGHTYSTILGEEKKSDHKEGPRVFKFIFPAFSC